MPRATHRPYGTCRHRILAPRPGKRRAGVQRCPHWTLHAVVAHRAQTPRRSLPAGFVVLQAAIEHAVGR
ncbi:Hypothetical protein SLIV_32777 [Streptomyces lividans TK24]|uniref:Secreted protein n=1 Tax=Streptomyces lividans TK24 TaxID=457428 RepID=A0ABX6TQP8_STRLI|nr:Hypothetical protein SLIV_32777 [Streptomyces lividans TK24]QSJ13050.1 Hypothetical protein SLIVDG2_32777 [Streptomyces lividans]QTD73960.1 Hypothetical protein SLIVYQS_32777 [Streptomyces lividans TK24] [Streptomyces lividans]